MDLLAPVVGHCNNACDPGASFCAITGSDQSTKFI